MDREIMVIARRKTWFPIVRSMLFGSIGLFFTSCGSYVNFLNAIPQDTNNPSNLSGSFYARLSLSSNDLIFGDHPVNSINYMAVTVTNTGAQPATSFAVTGFTAPFGFRDGNSENGANPCSNGIPASGGTCTFLITFVPTAIPSLSQMLTVSYYDGTLTQKLSLNVSGGGSNVVQLQIVDASDNFTSVTDFGTLVEGSAAVTKALTVIYGGDQTGAIGVTFSTPTDGFSVVPGSNTCASQVFANCSLTVSFDPSTVGAASAEITVNYNNHAGVSSSSQNLAALVVPPTPATPEPSLVFESSKSGPVVTSVNVGTNLLSHIYKYQYIVSNTGSSAASKIAAALTQSSSSLVGGTFSFTGSGFPGAAGTCSATLASGSTCIVEVQFAAAAAASATAATASLSLSYVDSGLHPFQSALSLTGKTGNLPSITITPVGTSTTPYNVGSYSVGYTHNTTFTMTNSSLSVPASVTSIGLSTTEYKFTSTNPCVGNLGSGSSCNFTVAFTPDSASTNPPADQTFNDTVVVNYADANSSDGAGSIAPATDALTGQGKPDALLVFSSGYSFGNVYIGKSSTLTPTILHYGLFPAGSIVISGVSAPFTFNALPTNCQTSIDSSCATSMTFAPTVAGLVTPAQTLSIQYTTLGAGSATATATAAISGTGVVPTAELSLGSASGAFGNIAANTPVTKNFAVTFSGSASSVSSLVVSLSSTSGFQISSNNCNGTASCTIGITANLPSPGNYSSVLSLAYFDGVANQNVKLNLSASNLASLSISGNIAFGLTPMGTPLSQVLKLSNGGQAQASSVQLCNALSAPWSILSNSCGSTLGPNQSCSINVQFYPTWPGSQPASLCFNYADGSGSTQTASAGMTGAGTSQMLVGAGGNHTCVVSNINSLYCWGDNANGELGFGGTSNQTQGSTAVSLPLPTGVWITQIALGGNHTCVLGSNGSMWCWGANQSGQCGDGSSNATIPVSDLNSTGIELGTGVTATSIAAGYGHTCAITNGPQGNGRVVCWGDNTFGKLGIGSTTNVGGPGTMGNSLVAVPLPKAASSLSLDAGHSCAMMVDGSMLCWGYNNYGQLGQGTQTTEGDQPGEIADLPVINFGSGDTAAAISVGGGFSAVLDVIGNVKEWGYNYNGLLGTLWCAGNTGYGSCSNPSFPISLDGYGDNSGQMGNALPAVNLGSGVKATAIAAADTSICAMTHVGSAAPEIVCWGNNSSGQLGFPSPSSVGTNPSQMGSALVPVPLAATPATLVAGESHMCVLTTSNVMYCWGDNSFGQLGTGGYSAQGSSFTAAIY
jgi:alpha-tubulin suppressor-like RCC1 family protein